MNQRCLPDAVVWNVFTFLIIIGVITCFFIHLINYFFWIRLNSVLDVTLRWHFVRGIFQKDINKFHNKRGDFRRNQSTIFREDTNKLCITGVSAEGTRVTLDLFIRVIVCWFFHMGNDFSIVRLQICYRKFLIDSDFNWAWTIDSNMPTILTLLTLNYGSNFRKVSFSAYL